MISNSKPENTSIEINSLIIMHPISRVDAENISARLRSSPIEVPVIVGRHLKPSTLLKVVQQHRFVHVGAKANLHALILVVSDSEICVGIEKA